MPISSGAPGRSVTLIAAAVLFSASVAPDWWSVASGVNGMDEMADVSSLTCHDGQCSVWEATRYADVRPGGKAVQTDLVDYDCVAGSTRTRKEITAGRSGVVTKKTAGLSPWQKIEPGTVGSASFLFACGIQRQGEAALSSGVTVFGGARYVRAPKAAVPHLVQATTPRSKPRTAAPHAIAPRARTPPPSLRPAISLPNRTTAS